MDPKKLVDDFVEGKITEDQFIAEKEKLSAEDLAKLDEAAKSAIPTATQKLIDVRRGTKKIEEAAPAAPDFGKKFREENLAKAKQRIATEIAFEKEEDRIAFLQEFEQRDPGSVDVENIVRDMKSHYAAKHPEEFFDLKKRSDELKANADEFTSMGAGPNGTGQGGGDGGGKKKYSPEAIALYNAGKARGSTLTIDQYQAQVEAERNKSK